MGNFLITIDGGPQIALPNTLHHEGMAVLMRRVFPPFTDPLSFHMGVSGLNLSPPEYRPDPLGGYFTPETTLAEVLNDGNDSGGYSERHRELLQLDYIGTLFSVTMRAGACFVETPWCEFTNAIEWAWTPDSFYENLDPPQTPPSHFQNYTYERNHGFPWMIPRVDPGHYLRQDPEVPEPLADAIAANLMRGCSLPLGAVYIATASELVASSIFAGLPHGLAMRPGKVLRARYVGQVFP